MRATVVITTRNRCGDLSRAIASALAQSAKPDVLVVDDGSMDGTSSMVARKFPSVRLHRSELALGLIAQRNRAARLVETPVIFSLDDDAVFSTPEVVETTLREFGHPRVGAVALPFIDVNRGAAVHQKAPDPNGVYASYDFIGTAHALRRDVFLALGGYRDILIHQGEEEDYCIRMLKAGWFVRRGNADPVHHFESPKRSRARMDYYGARNKVLYAWHNVPFPAVVPHLAGTTAKTLAHSLRPDRLWTRFRGVASAYLLCAGGRLERQPAAKTVYQLSQELKRRGVMPFDQIAHRLPLPGPSHGSPEPAVAVTI